MRSTENVDMTPSQCRAARALIGLTQPALADAAGLGLSTVVDHEKERRAVSPSAIAAMRAALEAAGVLFLDQGDVSGGLGVALKG
jgi:DNA-binding XRE family transcriptional regulator